MPATSAVLVLSQPTALPVTILTRTQQIISNKGADPIYVGTSSATAVAGTGIRIGPDATVIVPTGAPLWAICNVAQAGGATDSTSVMELE